jgi:hypothetical protein
MFQVGSEVKCIDAKHCDFYEAYGNADDAEMVTNNVVYRVLEVLPTTNYTVGQAYANRDRGKYVIRIKTNSGMEWWVRAAAFKDINALNLPSWW